MALAGSSPADRQPAPGGLHLDLPSNNPFRNRASSPTSLSPDLPVNRYRMSANNPFADSSEVPSARPTTGANNANIPADIFNDLSLVDQPRGAGAPPPYAPPTRDGAPPPQGQRPTHPSERRDRPRGPLPSGGAPNSPRKPEHRPRRASESSIMEKDRRPKDPRDPRERPERRERTESEERRRRERRKEREERHRREKEQGGKSDGKPVRKPKGLDIIDQLDVTGIYGQGLFHHDGPFDACNPHRNARRVRNAPMQAFPADSANMAMGGSGPLRSKIDLDKFHGRGEEGFSEYANTRRADTTVVDPTSRIEPVHGEETYGLGTSTFLEGAPASRTAMQRRDSEDPAENGMGGGLSRKKSLAQRIRGMSAPRKYVPGELRSPEERYNEEAIAQSPSHIKASSAGGPVQARFSKENEINPFDNDYEKAFERKGTQIRIAEHERVPSSSRARIPASNGEPTLMRTRTMDADVRRGSSNEEERPTSGGGGGFIKRMKSLKGPRKPKADA